MPMHTIPQNVTSYEDKIVGIFVGRQFIYLAIGGLTAFILISTGGGAAVVFRFILAIGVVAFAAALALVKVNDRGFDIWVLSFMKAVLGPTEWAWHKQEPLMTTLISPDGPIVSGTALKPEPSRGDATRFNLQRKEAYKSFVSGSSKGLDADEQAFLQQLNFSEPIPQGAKITLTSRTVAPPMLTPSHPRRAATTEDMVSTDLGTVQTAKPLNPLAQSTSHPSFTVSINGKQQAISMLHNQRTNRSLSKELLVGGAMPVPVRGELRLNLDPAFQQELTNLIGFAPEGGVTMAAAAGQSLPINGPTAATRQPSAPATSPGAQGLVQPEPASNELMDIKMQAAADWRSNASAIRKKLQIEGAPTTQTPQSGPSDLAGDGSAAGQPTIDSGSDIASEHTPASAPNVPSNDVTVQDAPNEDRMRQQAAHFEDVAKRAQAQLGQQESLADKLRQEEQRSAAFARELLQNMQQPARPLTPLAQPTVNVPAAPQPLAVSPESLPALTTEANIINGFVFGADGQFVEGAVVVIKDESGEAKRALKSNKLGQFLVTTPLANGRYVVEVDKKGLSIDTINVELKGQPVLPLVIQAKAAI